LRFPVYFRDAGREKLVNASANRSSFSTLKRVVKVYRLLPPLPRESIQTKPEEVK